MRALTHDRGWMGTEGRKNEARVRLSAPRRDRAIADLAERQHGVISGAQLAALGLTARTAQYRARRGTLHRIHVGVYSIVPRSLLSRHGWWMAAVLACGDGAYLSHFSAIQLFGIRRGAGVRVDVTIAGRSRLAIPGIRIHRPRALDPAHHTIRAGIPCTTLAKTLLDLAPCLTREGLEGVLGQAEDLRSDFTGLPELLETSRGHRGIARLRAAACSRGIGLATTRNGLEERMLAICRRQSLPEPLVNHWIDLNDGLPMVEIDFYWPALRVAVETDGAGAHGTIRGVERDYAKERRLARAGIATTRFSEPEVFAHPGRVGRELVDLLARPARRAEPPAHTIPE